MYKDHILAALNLRHPGARVEPGKLIRVRMEYPDDGIPIEVRERIELASSILDRAHDKFAILDLMNHLSTMEIREATPENRKLNDEWNDAHHRLHNALTVRDSRHYKEVSDIVWGRATADA